VESVLLTATFGSTSYENADEDGMIVRSRSTDFLISADLLVVPSGKILPEVGDLVMVFSVEAPPVPPYEQQTFEVSRLGSEGHYRVSDPEGKVFRIHTRLVGKQKVFN
jgi:hypothetical protein